MMWHKNHKSGFALLEALAATALMGLMIVAFFGLQSSIIDRDTYNAQRLERMMIATNVLTSPEEAEPIKTSEQAEAIKESKQTTFSYTVKEPPTSVTVQIAPPKNKKFESLKNIKQISCAFSWPGAFGQESDSLIGFFFQPPKQKKNA